VAYLAFIATARAGAPPTIFPTESRPTTSRLADARKLLAEKKWSEAADELQAILDSGGSDLVTVTARYSVPARRQCHRLIAGLPPEELKAYRTRTEPQARKWLEEGRANRDVRLLRKLVDEAFCTRSGEMALDTLGDLAFEHGDYHEAEIWWRHLAPPPGAKGTDDADGDLYYPDPQIAPARIHAKQILARVFRDPRRDWTGVLRDYREAHGDAEGSLAGRKGKYADLLTEIARRAKAEAPADVAWSTYGGDAARGPVLPAQPRFFDELERLCRLGPTWRFRLEPKAKDDDGGALGPAATPSVLSRSLAFHPLVVGEHAVVADARSVTGFDLRSGASKVWFDVSELAKSALFAKPDLRLPLPNDLLDLRYTMTLADDCLYVRLGAQTIFHADDVDKNDPKRAAREAERDQSLASVLACLSVKPGPKDTHLRWAIRPVVFPGRPADVQGGAIFEGAPLVHRGQLYIAATYFANDRTVTAVICYPRSADSQARSASDGISPPAPRWVQAVCETQELRGRDRRTRHHLLTAAGPYVVYCSHSGAIVALDVLTGKPAWAVRYPSRSERENLPQPVLRDLSPPVYADGRLYVAPSDYDHLLCLDPATGQMIWDRDRLEATHLLGVGQGRLILTTIHGLRAVGAADGSDSSGWQLPDGNGERAPAGRGLLVGEKVLWPTAAGIVVCSQRDGSLDYRPTLGSQVPAGNLAYANGCLAVADRTTLSVFVPDGMVIGERKNQTRLHPADSAAWLGLARAQSDLGEFEPARECLRKARHLLPRGDHGLRDAVEDESLDMLMKHARRAADRADWAGADNAIEEAARADQPPQTRVKALVRAAQMWQEAGQPDRAVAVWQNLLMAEELRGESAFAFGRRQLTAGSLAAARIEEIQGRHGRTVDRNFGRHLQRGRESPLAGQSVKDLERLDLRLPLSRLWHTPLEAGECLLPVADCDALLLTGRPGWLTARAPDSGKPVWRRRLAFTPQWAARHLDKLVTGGPGGAACVREEDGGMVWKVAAPTLFAGGAADALGSFQLANGRFFFLAGQRWLFALDTATGRVEWSQSAPGAGLGLPSPSGRFNPALVAMGNAVLVQPTPGRTSLLDAANGQALRSLTVSDGRWWQPPVVCGDRAVCLAPDVHSILQVSSSTGRTQWEHALTEATTLTGEPPRLVGGRQVVLALLPTNLGDELVRLDPATGRQLWKEPVLLVGKSRLVEPAGWAWDEEAVYFEQGGRLCARSLADGNLLWVKPLAGRDVPYHTRRLRDFLLTFPVASGSARFQFRFLWGSVQWELSPGRDDGLALVCSDPKTGQVIERMNLSPRPPHSEIRLRQATRFTMQPRIEAGPVESGVENAVVLLSARGVVVALDQQMWRFNAADQTNHGDK
jgi:outer membrane protein assembly factor BamB